MAVGQSQGSKRKLQGMLIPGKSYSWVESRNSRVSIPIETLDFARVCNFYRTCWPTGEGRSPAGPWRRARVPSPPSDDGRSVEIAGQWRARNIAGTAGEGMRPGKRDGSIAPPPMKPYDCWAPLNNRSTSRADGRNVLIQKREKLSCLRQ